MSLRFVADQNNWIMSSILSNKKTKLAEAKNEARRAVVLESNKYLEKYSFVEYA